VGTHKMPCRCWSLSIKHHTAAHCSTLQHTHCTIGSLVVACLFPQNKSTYLWLIHEKRPALSGFLWCSVCDAVCCSVLQCAAVWCGELQCVAELPRFQRVFAACMCYTHSPTHTYILTDTHILTVFLARLPEHLCHLVVLHTQTHTYIHAYIHTYTHTYLHIYKHTYIHTYTHTHIHTYIHTFIHTHTYTHIHTYPMKYAFWLCASKSKNVSCTESLVSQLAQIGNDHLSLQSRAVYTRLCTCKCTHAHTYVLIHVRVHV